jgi:hypothetical protein
VKKNNEHLIDQAQSLIQTSSQKYDKLEQSFLEIETKVTLKDENESMITGGYGMNLLQTSLSDTSDVFNHQGIFILAEQENNRFTRFLWAMLIVMITSISCFMFVKSSVDWVRINFFKK